MTAEFEFMSSDEFRSVLEADRKEMNVCFESRAWKAVHVLAGSIVEAILADYVIAEKYIASDKASREGLADIIRILRERDAISSTLADLCSAIKNYRNLVHPGRSIRTQDSVDEHSARVAVSLVEMILKEVSEKRQAKHGYTAEQLLSKIRSDPSVKAILIHLLKDVNEREKERLLLEVLPNEYMKVVEDPEPDDYLPHIFSIIPTVFRATLEEVEQGIQKKVAKHFVQILKERPGSYVSTYELAFFRILDVKHLNRGDIQLVKDHISDQLKSGPHLGELFGCLAGMSDQVLWKDFRQFIRRVIWYAVQSNSEAVRKTARQRIFEEYYSGNEEFEAAVMADINSWVQHYQKVHQVEIAEKFATLKEEIEIPF